MSNIKTKLYDILGIDPKASSSDIKKAYRKKSKENHPDVAGEENGKKFTEIAHAYEVLSDKQRREKYDASGDDTDNKKSHERKIENVILTTFMKVVNSYDAFQNDIIEHMNHIMDMTIREFKNQISKAKKDKSKLEKIQKKLHYNGNQFDILGNFTDSQISSINNQIEQMKEEISLIEEAMVIMKDYNFDIEKVSSSNDDNFVNGWSQYVQL